MTSILSADAEAAVAAPAGPISLNGASLASAALAFGRQFGQRLRDIHFWVVQAMIFVVTAMHALVELLEVMPDHAASIYFIPASLYFFPVLYASLNFGREGAIPTAIWIAIVTVPNVLLWHQGMERFGEAFQVTTIVVLASLVAHRVDREIAARRDAEARGRELAVSEMKYRRLFEGAAEAILVLDDDCQVREGNTAAEALFGHKWPRARDVHLKDLVGEIGERSVKAAVRGQKDTPDLQFQLPGQDVWLEPMGSRMPGQESHLYLAMFKDVTLRARIQSYAREVLRAQEEERQRLSREIHDVGLQSIVLLCRRLDRIEEEFDVQLPAAASVALDETRRFAEEIGADLRRFSRGLRPSVLDDLGLAPAIRTLTAELAQRAGVEARLNVRGAPERLAPEAELALFRIAQEALNNVERHARASRLSARLTFDKGNVSLRITDNGRGFRVLAPVIESSVSSRLGLLGMQERAALVGGSCQIRSQPGRGTQIIAIVPTANHDGQTPAQAGCS